MPRINGKLDQDKMRVELREIAEAYLLLASEKYRTTMGALAGNKAFKNSGVPHKMWYWLTVNAADVSFQNNEESRRSAARSLVEKMLEKVFGDEYSLPSDMRSRRLPNRPVTKPTKKAKASKLGNREATKVTRSLDAEPEVEEQVEEDEGVMPDKCKKCGKINKLTTLKGKVLDRKDWWEYINKAQACKCSK